MKLLRLLPRFRHIDQTLREFEAREGWSRHEIEAYQLERINRLWSSAKNDVPYYRKLAQDCRLPERFHSLDEYSRCMPTLSKQSVRLSRQEFLSERPKAGRWHLTGGSTGNPTAVYREHIAHAEMLRGRYRCEQAHGLDVLDNKVFLWGHEGSFSPGWKGLAERAIRPWEDWLRNRLRLSAYDLSEEALAAHVLTMQRFQPRSIYGYSSAVMLLAQVVGASAQLLPTLKLAILTAEPSDQDMRQQVAEMLQCTAVVEYGAVECGLLAYGMPDGTIRTRDDTVFIETIPKFDEPLQNEPYSEPRSYDIVVTVLNNASFPLLRYRIEDVTSQPVNRPANGFGILTDVQGRANDHLVGMHGKKLHSMALKHALECWPDIRRFHAYQDRDGHLKITLETPHGISAKLVRQLENHLTDLIEGFPVEIRTLPLIAGNLAGKHRWIVSDRVRTNVRQDNGAAVSS
jgi:phenylacetate-CoA ligase